jgi:hypothetical protein
VGASGNHRAAAWYAAEDICPHRIRYQNGRPGDTFAGSVSVSLTREAIGQDRQLEQAADRRFQ